MCIKCDLKKTKGFTQLSVSSSAVDSNGLRTIWGPYVDSDFEKIFSRYSELSRSQLEKYIGFFAEPRLSEILGPLELLRRVVEKKFSQIRDLDLSVAYNPLSILTTQGGHVIRIKTKESELLHKSMEKLALRTKTLQQINDFFDELFNIQILFACSCGVGAVYTQDVKAFTSSEYYCQREGYGRMFDSDMLATTGNLFYADSVDLVPKKLLQSSRDVGNEEVLSYKYYYATLLEVINSSPEKVIFKDPSGFFN